MNNLACPRISTDTTLDLDLVHGLMPERNLPKVFIKYSIYYHVIRELLYGITRKKPKECLWQWY
jgi:hypothetical protein